VGSVGSETGSGSRKRSLMCVFCGGCLSHCLLLVPSKKKKKKKKKRNFVLTAPKVLFGGGGGGEGGCRSRWLFFWCVSRDFFFLFSLRHNKIITKKISGRVIRGGLTGTSHVCAHAHKNVNTHTHLFVSIQPTRPALQARCINRGRK